MKENSINNWEEMTVKHTNNRMQKKPNDFGLKYGDKRKHNEKAEWINNIERKLQRLEEGLKAEIHIDLLKTTLKRYQIEKTPGYDGIHGFWFKKFTSIHDRLALEMNKCLQTAHVPEWMIKARTHIDPKGPKQLNSSKQLQTYNVLTDDVENINGTNKGRNLLLANKPWFVS